jgi:HlyD family secretion protein
MLEDADVPGFVDVLESQRAIFETRTRKLSTEILIAQKTIATLLHRVDGDASRLEAVREQLRLLQEELQGKKTLFDQKLVRKPDYLAAKRAEANAEGEIGRIEAEIRDGLERVASAREQINRLRTVAVQAAVEERQTNGAELKDIRERIAAVRAILSRLDIVAPVTGVVVKRNYHTPGGVIRPGNDILAILPAGDELVIEANIRPQDIDPVRKGQNALVRLTALNQRTTPMVDGFVVYVSADAVTNEKKPDRDNIYVARVRLDAAAAAAVPGFLPTPGMPAEVYIKTGQRTFFEYLAKPVLDVMSRAFREN